MHSNVCAIFLFLSVDIISTCTNYHIAFMISSVALMGITRSLLPQNKDKLPLPLFGVIFGWFCMILLEQITIKPSQIITLFSSLWEIALFFFKIPHFMFSDKCTKYSLSHKNTQTIYQKRVTFCNFWNRSSHRNDCFWFLEFSTFLYQNLQ